MIKIVLFLSFLLNSIFLISLNDNDIIPIEFDGESYKEYYVDVNEDIKNNECECKLF